MEINKYSLHGITPYVWTSKEKTLKEKIKRGVLETFLLGTELLIFAGFLNGIGTCWPRPYDPNGNPSYETNRPCAALRTIENRKKVLDYNYKLEKEFENYFSEKRKKIYQKLFSKHSE